MITAVFEYHKIIQSQQLFLQIANREGTYCRNVLMIVSVTPRPIIIKGQLKGIIDKTTIEKIPIVNALSSRQNCFIKISQIS